MKKLIPMLMILALLVSQMQISFAQTQGFNVINSVVSINTYNDTGNDELEWMGSGSGTIISDDGMILTNYHVLVDENDEFVDYIELCYTLSEFEPPYCLEDAYVFEYNADMDLALLYPFMRYDYETGEYYELTEEDYQGYPAITFRSNTVTAEELPALRERIEILGYPGASLTGNIVVTEGIVTGYLTVSTSDVLKEAKIDINSDLYDQMLELFGSTMTLGIETDATINPGNSGGAAIDSDDRFVGIPTYFSVGGEAGQYGYVIPTNVINLWLNQLVAEGKLPFNPSMYIYDNNGFDELFLFLDVDDTHPNYDAIKYLKDNSIINGYPDGSFQPEGEITRAELMKILALATGIEISPDEYNNCFPDVTDDWYAKYVCYAKQQGWVEGYPDGTFKPGNNVVKAEAIKMVLNTQGIVLDPVGSVKPFNDVELGDWFAPYVVTAKNLGILEENGIKYNPGNNATRGGVSENIYRVIK